MSAVPVVNPIASMMHPAAEISPRLKARVAGALYLISGTFYTYAGGSVRGKLVVAGNDAATAQSILSHTALYWRFRG